VPTTGLLREFNSVRQGLLLARIPVHVRWSLSTRIDSSIVITPARIVDRPFLHEDLVTTNLFYRDGQALLASPDLRLHREIYAGTRHRSVLTCLPPHAMTLASMNDSMPLSAGSLKVLEEGPQLLGNLTRLLRNGSAGLIRGQTLVAAALDPTSCLEVVRRIESESVGILG